LFCSVFVRVISWRRSRKVLPVNVVNWRDITFNYKFNAFGRGKIGKCGG